MPSHNQIFRAEKTMPVFYAGILDGQAKDIAASAKAYRETHPYVQPNVVSKYPDIPNVQALGASEYKGVGDVINQYAYNATNGAVGENTILTPENIADLENKISGFIGSGSGSGRGSGSSGPSADAILQSQTMQDYIKMINDTTAANNAWAAAQAQKQMDFQERMARNAHRYEVEDLKAAGLNPVLSAGGGNGAAAASGAMAQPDTSNTRLMAEMSMAAVDSLGSNAVQIASGYNSHASNSFKDKLLGAAAKYFVPTLVRGAASAISRGLFG